MPVHTSLAIVARFRVPTTAVVTQLGTENQAALVGLSRREHTQHLAVQRIPSGRCGLHFVLERDVH